MGLRQLAQYAAKATGGTATPFQVTGAPTSGAGGTMAGKAVVGSLLVDVSTGKLYSCTASGAGSVTWQLVGLQT